MLQLKIENKYGEQFNFSETTDYEVVITGLTPPNATINTSVLATADGSQFNSSRLNDRNIVMTIYPTRNVEQNRINLYRYIKSKQYIKLYLTTDSRDVWIDGYVTSIDGDLYENPQRLQVSIICPDPYFKSMQLEITNFSNVTGQFEFPFAIDNDGVEISTLTSYGEKTIFNSSDDETGVVIELHAMNTVLEPTIYNQTTNERFTIEYEMQLGDKIILDTRKGKKSLKVIHDGVESNIINNMVPGSDWFNLVVGDNIFSYTCIHGAASLALTITVQPIFEGV